MVHSRGYNDHYDTYSFRIHECNIALMNAKNTDSFVYIFRKYGEWMTDYQISYAWSFIGNNNFERDAQFWEFIYPVVKKQIATLDRNCVRSLY